MRAILAAALLGTAATPAFGEGVPRTYDVTPVESSNPIPGGGGNFGWGVTSADLTGDGKMELLVAQSQDNVPGEVFIYDGVTSRLIDTIQPPEKNPDTATRAEAMAFVYIEHMADIGSCPGGKDTQNPVPNRRALCADARVGGLDGIPEIITGSRSLRVDTNSPLDSEIDALDPAFGRAYVFDGKTRAVLKRIDMPPNERLAQRNRHVPGPQTTPNPGTPTPANTAISTNFGRAMTSPQGLPPCDGNPAEANNAGVGPCEDMPKAVRIGDVDGLANNPATEAAARGDIVLGVRGYRETSTPGRPNTAPIGSQCGGGAGGNPAPTAPTEFSTSGNCTSGKGFIYKGEEIANSSPREILDGVTNGNATGISTPETAPKTLVNPWGQTTSSDVFGNLQRIGDVGCLGPATADPNICAGQTGRNFFQDGKPEIVGIDPFIDYPVTSPDGNAFPDIGVAHVYDGETGTRRDSYENPEPDSRSIFSHNFNAGWPVGNLGHSTHPDFLTGAPAANEQFVGDGKAFVWNGEATSSRGRLIGSINDPTPKPAGNFGSSYTGVGDLLTGQEYPANEVMIGTYSPFITSTEAANSLIGDVHIMNATRNRLIQTIPDPVQEPGSGFGMGMTPMGDLNDDGFLDFAISSYLSNIPGQPADGRAYIFRSNNSPLPPAPESPGATVSTPRLIRPGRCANDTIGTARSDNLKGTTAGDRMIAFGGDDRVEGFADDDCLDGGTGADRLLGAAGADRVIGGSGRDRMLGGNERDRLFGGSSGDKIKGGYGTDMVAGGRGNDRLDGGPETDRVFGESGNDRIRSGGGRNILDGGTGNDRIFARNHRRDVIRCGSGRDRVSADRTDRVQIDCERIRRARR